MPSAKKAGYFCTAGRQAEALAVIDVALGITRDSLALLVEKGMVLHELGRNEDAIRILDSTIEMDRKSAYALGAKGRIMADLGRYKEALASFGRALNIEPKNISLWMDFIRIFEQKKNYSTALNIVHMAMEKNPDNQDPGHEAGQPVKQDYSGLIIFPMISPDCNLAGSSSLQPICRDIPQLPGRAPFLLSLIMQRLTRLPGRARVSPG